METPIADLSSAFDQLLELFMDPNRNLFRQECIDFLGTVAEMELFCGLLEQEQEFRLTN